MCFCHYYQWIAIIPSKGSCHFFALSPFGGNASLQTIVSLGKKSIPVSHCIFTMAVYFIFHPKLAIFFTSAPCYLLGVSNTATSVEGKLIFHSSSVSRGLQDVQSGVNSLEHLLVYTPSGYVIKLELLPSIEAELNESDLATRSGLYVHSQDEEFLEIIAVKDNASRYCLKTTLQAQVLMSKASGNQEFSGLLLLQVLSGTARETALAILGSKAVPSDQVALLGPQGIIEELDSKSKVPTEDLRFELVLYSTVKYGERAMRKTGHALSVDQRVTWLNCCVASKELNYYSSSCVCAILKEAFSTSILQAPYLYSVWRRKAQNFWPKLPPPEIKWQHYKVHNKKAIISLVGTTTTYGNADGSTIIASCSEGI
ncbi:unnamed protein product [Ilex paraguariensis]|uniref:Uncharacterized protein n=1 Tax=Ilex paraguariensis TaxID=185542 RepID=A0ABC8V127_9AQUA